MREVKETDPHYIVSVAMAANALARHGEASTPPDAVKKVLFNIALLRAAAFGWRETQDAFQSGYRTLKRRDAKHDASLTGKYEKAADRLADKLCKAVSLPFEFQGEHESGARQFWTAFRTLYVEVQDEKIPWLLIAFVTAKNDPNAIREVILEKLSDRAADAGLPPNVEQNKELLSYARIASDAILGLVRSYEEARAKAMLN